MGNYAEGDQCIPIGEIIYLLKTQRHDFVNHLQVLQGYLQLGKTEMAVKYLKDISKEMTEFGRVLQLPWPELAAVLMLKDKQARADQTKVKLSLGNNLEKVCENPSESVAKIVGDIYELICKQLGSCSLDRQQIQVEVNVENGAYVIRFSWPEDPKGFDKMSLLAHPVMEAAQKNLRKIDLQDQNNRLLLTLYLPECANNPVN
jgi:hypothetical protein